MINILELVRRNKLGSLFNPTQTFGGSYSSPQMNEPINENMPNLPTEMQGRFKDMLGQFPEREKVGNWRKLGSVIAGLGSDNPIETADQFANYNYYNKLKDYTTKLPFFQRASENERQLNNQIMTQWMADRKQDETERKNRQTEQFNRTKLESQEEIARKKLEIQEKRAAVYEFKARNPNYQFIKDDATGKVYAVHPQDPTKKVDTGLTHGDLSDLDKANLNLRNAVEIENVRQGNRIDLENTRSANTVKEIDARGNVQKDVITHRTLTGVKFGTSSTSKPETEANRKQRFTNSARVLIGRYPEWTDYVKFDKNGQFEKIEPKGVSGKMTQLTPAQIQNLGNIIFERQPLPDRSKEDTKKSNDPLGIRK